MINTMSTSSMLQLELNSTEINVELKFLTVALTKPQEKVLDLLLLDPSTFASGHHQPKNLIKVSLEILICRQVSLAVLLMIKENATLVQLNHKSTFGKAENLRPLLITLTRLVLFAHLNS
jgi:hypothetical protein